MEFDIDTSVNIGQSIKDYIHSRSDLSIRKVASLLGKSHSGFNDKLNTVHYGTALDLIEISIVLSHDFISPLLRDIQNSGVKLATIPATPENIEAVNNYQNVKEDVLLWKSIVKKNYLT